MTLPSNFFGKGVVKLVEMRHRRAKRETVFEEVTLPPFAQSFVHLMAPVGPAYLVCSRCGLWMLPEGIEPREAIAMIAAKVPRGIVVQGILRGTCWPCERAVVVSWGMPPATESAA